jgi:hypothetical protein
LSSSALSFYPTSAEGFILRTDPKPGQSKYLNVNFMKACTANPYVAVSCVDKKRKYLGYFPTEEAAALCYLKEHLKVHAGDFDGAGRILRPHPKPDQSKFQGVLQQRRFASSSSTLQQAPAASSVRVSVFSYC